METRNALEECGNNRLDIPCFERHTNCVMKSRYYHIYGTRYAIPEGH